MSPKGKPSFSTTTRDTTVSDFEFMSVLNRFGFEDEEVRAIDRWGSRLQYLPIAEFVRALRDEVGVSALHERAIHPPARDPGPRAEMAQATQPEGVPRLVEKSREQHPRR